MLGAEIRCGTQSLFSQLPPRQECPHSPQFFPSVVRSDAQEPPSPEGDPPSDDGPPSDGGPPSGSSPPPASSSPFALDFAGRSPRHAASASAAKTASVVYFGPIARWRSAPKGTTQPRQSRSAPPPRPRSHPGEARS